MSEQRRFGESDHEPLDQDDILAEAISQWREELPSRDLWQGVATRIREHQQPVVATQRFFRITIAQMAIAATLLMAVASGLTYLATRPPAVAGITASREPVIQAYGVPDDQSGQQIVPANFADAQFNAAVTDLEQILRDERDRLDPRTVLIIERNLKAIDAAINEARMALNDDPANPYLNSHLADARRRKLDLLRTATTLASTGGD
jgi:negative regulator of sigma E activity